MSIPKLVRDETKTKIINKNEVISYINNSENYLELKEYLTKLENQNKVDKNELIDIIEAVKNKLLTEESIINEYELIKNDFDKLADFYESNIEYIRHCMYNMNINNIKFVIDFMKYCLLRQQNGFQNKFKSQITYNEFKNYYINNKEKFSEKLQSIFDDILNEENNIINNVNIEDDYKEDNYLTRTQVLSLSHNNKGYNLTEEDLKLNSKAFVATTIILEATLAIGLIIALIFVFK